MQKATRSESLRHLGLFEFSQIRTLGLTLASGLIAAATAYLPTHSGLEGPGRHALFVLAFCALMWVSEAIPAFATSLLAIGLLIVLLGKPGGGFASDPHDWEMFIQPWGSPLIWLFFGGFCLAAGAERTGLDRWLALRAMKMFGAAPAMVLLGVMLTTAILSMFISNTATATLMLAVLGPLLASRPEADPFPKCLLLGVAFAANLGGMGTLIGSPPNAIAAGLLASAAAPIDFARWMALGAPPALALLALAWVFLVVRYLGRGAFAPLDELRLGDDAHATVLPLRRWIVVLTFSATVLLWITTPLTGLPTTVVSLLPICMFTGTAILTSDDIRQLPWDILLLITGGLSLGVAVQATGLADWMVGKMPAQGLPLLLLVAGLGFLTVLLSNLISNTATAGVILPLAVAMLSTQGESPGDVRLLVPIALCASLAMGLPISTPPNAIVYSTRRLNSLDLLAGGLLVGVVGPVVVTAWCLLALQWV